MPELPEVEHLRRSLAPRLLGRRIASVRVLRREVIVAPGDPAGGFARARQRSRPLPISDRALLAGASISEMRRLGKQLAIVADDGRTLCVHLGMTGQLRWESAAAGFNPMPAADFRGAVHDHVLWTLDDGSRLVFRDPRRFGGIWVFDSLEALIAARWGSLGPDALNLRGPELARLLANRHRSIKATLLDQSIIAGIGNIYADEALFRAKVRPTRRSDRIKPGEAKALAGAIRAVLAASIRAGGSTLRDYRDAVGAPGHNQRSFRVYGRLGRPCLACGTALRGLRIAQRATVWCPKCQR